MQITEWGIRNPITITLISMIVLATGLFSGLRLQRTKYPKFAFNRIDVTISMMDGATPEQIDESIIKVVQPQLQSIPGVKEIYSFALPDYGMLQLQVDNDVNVSDVIKDIKDKLDTIHNLPKSSRPPIVKQYTKSDFITSIYLAVTGRGVPQKDLEIAAEHVKTELINNFGIDNVRFLKKRDFELTISIPVENLTSKHLTINDIANQIKSQNLDIFSGEIKNSTGTVIIKGGHQKKSIDVLKKLPITLDSGKQIRLEDLVGSDNFNDGLGEEQIVMEMNGRKSVILEIPYKDELDIIKQTGKIEDYAAQKKMPDHMQIRAFFNDSYQVRDSLGMVTKNALMGLVLLLLMLALFLNWKIALWTTMGVTFSLIGAVIVVYLSGQTFNMMVMLGFMVASGLIVDDAIIIGERFYHKCEDGMSPSKAAISAADELAWPIFTMVSTSIAAFTALLFIPGIWGELISAFAIAVMAALVLSLIESLTILPVHLAHHSTADSRMMNLIELCFYPIIKCANYLQPRLLNGLEFVGDKWLQPMLAFFINHRYAFAILFISGVVIEFQLINHKFIKIEAEPVTQSDQLIASIRMIPGTSVEDTTKQARHVVASLRRLGHEIAKKNEGVNPIKDYLLTVGVEDSHVAEVRTQLRRSQHKGDISGLEFLDLWRESTSPIPGIKSIIFYPRDRGATGIPIDIFLKSNNEESLENAESELVDHLADIPGLIDTNSSKKPGPLSVQIDRMTEYQNSSIPESQILQTITNRYYGKTIDFFYRDNNEVKIKLRAQFDDRSDLSQLSSIRLENGLILSQVAELSVQRKPLEIRRVDGKKSIEITADIEHTRDVNVTEIRDHLINDYLPKLTEKYPGLEWSYGSEAADSLGGMVRIFIVALCVIYLILATYFRSYLEPIIVMFAIVIAMLGATLGHWIMGVPISIITGFGVVGLAGIVVNDSVIVVESIKTLVKNGSQISDALIDGAKNRLLPIFLTSITLIVSSSPLLFESSPEAIMLIPVIVSYVFGLAFSTVVILFVIPIGYAIILDQIIMLNKIFYGSSRSAEELING